MSAFVIEPYIGTNKIKFSTSEEQCKAILGEPIRQSKNRKNEPKLVYKDQEVTLEIGGARIVEIAFRPDVMVLLHDIDVFNDVDALAKLSKIDAPLEYVGILFFQALGISATGLHNQDDKVVTAISLGRFDAIAHNFCPYEATQ